MRNSYKPWTSEELDILKYMVQQKYSMRRMEKILGRTRRAIQHAFHNILYQQLIQYDADTVAESYDYDVDDLIEGFVPPKYYQKFEEPRELSSCSYFTSAFFGILGAACVVYYGYLLNHTVPNFLDVV
jgi:hypothetical protein